MSTDPHSLDTSSLAQPGGGLPFDPDEISPAYGENPPPDAPARGPVVVRLDAVEIEEVEWLWKGRIPRGKVSLIVGDPGLGKSFLTLDMAARVSCGLAWPDGDHARRGDVVLLSAEDGLADTIAPRLLVAGADRSRIHALSAIRDERGERPFDLSRDVAQLARVIGDLRAAARVPVLVVIDPITAYLGRDVDSHVAAEVRGALAPLAALAERERVAVACVAHLNKAATRALYRVSGSLAFVAAARAVLAVAADPADPTGPRRILGPLKSNLGLPPPTLAFQIDNGRVVYESGPVNVDIAAALRGPDEARERAPQDGAADFLRDVLADGPMPPVEIVRQAKEAGISERTLRRAKERIGVKAYHDGFGTGSRWVWQLEDGRIDAKAPKASTPNGGHLRREVAIFAEPRTDELLEPDDDPMLRATLEILPGAYVEDCAGRPSGQDEWRRRSRAEGPAPQ